MTVDDADTPIDSAETTTSPGLLPGLGAAAGIAAVALAIDTTMSGAGIVLLNAVFLAVVMGLVLRVALGERTTLKPGVGFAAKRALRAGVVLLGFRFGLAHVADVGVGSLLAIISVVSTAFLIVFALLRLVPMSKRLGVLIAAGTAICGNSAIAAVAPLIDARDEEISFATGTITLFGTVAMLIYPALGLALGIGDDAFGLFAGVGVHDSGQAIAAGFIFSAAAGGTATVVKLTRTAFLVPLLLAVSAVRWRQTRSAGEGVSLSSAIPWFALGFLATSGFRTVGDRVLAETVWWAPSLEVAAWVATFLILIAMAGIGMGTDIAKLRRVGGSAFLVGLVAASTVSAVALVFALSI